MSVMNIKHLFLAAATLTVFAACSDYDPGMSENVLDYTDEQLETLNEYAKNFVEYYGDIDPNHTWGFGEMGSEDEVMNTRSSYPNSNGWIKVIKGKVPKRDASGNIIMADETNPEYEYNGQDVVIDLIVDTEYTKGVTNVPGFPVRNYYLTPTGGADKDYTDYYHVGFPNVKDENGLMKEFWFEKKDDLIQYMRDHENITEVMPLGDVARCNTLEDPEVSDVYAEFSKVWKGTNPTVDLKSYFVQQVWRGTAEYRGEQKQDGSWGDYFIGASKMDYLGASNPSQGITYDHFYNYNNATFSNGQCGMMLIYDSTTKGFVFKSSLDGREYYSYRLVQLHGNWYVGFDFQSHGGEEKEVDQDYKYNDWIVKIIPGEGYISDEPEYTHKWYRIMCEDLGSTFDYDFNDLVFDVYFTGESPNYTANIKVKAAGGVYPIYIGEENPANEAHRLLGRSDTYDGKMYKPINVGGETGIHTDILQLSVNSTNPDLIPIIVDPTGTSNPRNTFILPERLGGYKTSNEWTNPEVPQKICIPGNTTKWTKEYQWIDKAYPHFPEWVHEQDGTYGFPYKTVDGKKKYFEADGTGWKLVTDPDKTPWNTVDIDESYLYQ